MVIFQFAMLNVYQSVNLHFPMVFLWLSQNYMVFLWFSYFSYGFPMIFLWFSYGFPMIVPFSYGFPMVFLWLFHFPMVFLWFSYDCTIFLWFSYGFPMPSMLPLDHLFLIHVGLKPLPDPTSLYDPDQPRQLGNSHPTHWKWPSRNRLLYG